MVTLVMYELHSLIEHNAVFTTKILTFKVEFSSNGD